MMYYYVRDDNIIGKFWYSFLQRWSVQTNHVNCLNDWTKIYDNMIVPINKDMIYLDYTKVL